MAKPTALKQQKRSCCNIRSGRLALILFIIRYERNFKGQGETAKPARAARPSSPPTVPPHQPTPQIHTKFPHAAVREERPLPFPLQYLHKNEHGAARTGLAAGQQCAVESPQQIKVEPAHAQNYQHQDTRDESADLTAFGKRGQLA